ncbi:MFS transporter [Bacillus sp. DTU_2020_1000418_1_SI_GHA_SEK_038]|uniref:MFS transporter n=1 Tax=Bacillus sp. DTU_2020_1000418_1_SI_GHA_SEK_038 TaxID=3077585 RepID=UPI0028F145D2|nr:MFS transporter [Bacillus sp. DTU_2020_1000418_1_SI_GHA_SEK_038]WNS75464.1 MFS transporter [Bacillus sp. DTU_2020_1000418_1_SI_GHA_SEK_038]
MTENILGKKTRKTLVVLLFLGWMLGNLDRYLMNYAVVHIGKDLALTATETGLILSSFFLGYALMQLPGGILADKFGAKRVLLAAIIVWSIFTGLTAIAWTLSIMVVIRFLFGIGEGGFQPSASKIISSSFPENERSKVMSIMLSSGAIMMMLVPIISAALLVTIGWRAFFVIAGLFGVIIAFLYWKYVPKDKVVYQSVQGPQVKGILGILFKMPLMWSLVIAYFTIYAVNWGLNSWMPKYLSDVRGLDLISIGWLQMIPGIIMVIAMLGCGYLIDKLDLKVNKFIGAICALLLAGCLFLMFNAESIALFITYQSIVTLLMTYVVLLLPSFVLKRIPSDYAGTAMGMANTGGQLAGFVTPTLIGFMVDTFNGSYNAAMWLLVVISIICVGTILTISPKSQANKEVVVHE